MALFIVSALFLSGCSDGLQFRANAKPTIKKPKPPSPPGPKGESFTYRNVLIDSESEEFRPEIKLGLVVDNSQSMADEQLALSQGFSAMLDSLKNNRFNLEFLIFTTSNDGGSKQAVTPFTEYRYVDGSGQLVVTEDEGILSQKIPLTRRSGFRLAEPLKDADPSPLRISTTMNESEFTAMSQRIQSVIQTIGTSGSNNERGLCTLGRMLTEENAARRIFEDQDLSALMIVSDANDANSNANCHAYTEVDFGAVTPDNPYTPLQPTNCRPDTGCEPAATRWEYRQKFRSIDEDRITVRYYPVACTFDGQRREPCVPDTYQFTFNRPRNEFPSSPEVLTDTPCTQEIIDWINSHGSYEDVRVSGNGSPTCHYRHYKSTTHRQYSDLSNLETNLCSEEFQTNGQTYANLLDYYQRTDPALSSFEGTGCDSVYASGTTYAGGRFKPTYGIISSSRNTSVRDLLEPTAPHIKEALVSKADQLFGPENFVLSAMVHSEYLNEQYAGQLEPNCPPESEGVLYRDLVALLGEQATEYPICLANYSPAISPLQRFIETIIENVYEVDLEPTEQIVEIYRLRGSERRLLVLGVDYHLNGERITFEEGQILVGDKLDVRIRKPV